MPNTGHQRFNKVLNMSKVFLESKQITGVGGSITWENDSYAKHYKSKINCANKKTHKSNRT